MMSTNQTPEEAFLRDLESSLATEWRHHYGARLLVWAAQLGVWISRILIMAVATFTFGRQMYAMSSGSKIEPLEQFWVGVSLQILAVMNIGIPLLAYQMRFQQRQVVFDRNARDYANLRLDWLTGQVKLPEATVRLKEIRSRLPENDIRSTP
jgi:hypothetical protein